MAKKKKGKEQPIVYSWLIAYVDVTYIDRVYDDLKRSPEYKDIEVYIPTVKILKKTEKKEARFEEVPLLFNYGFFKVPRKYAVHAAFLDNMKQNINCIFAWVKDICKVMNDGTRLNANGESVFEGRKIPVATATSEEIARLVEAAYYTSMYDQDDITKLSPGQMVILRGYPFDNMMVEIVEVHIKKQKVTVEMTMFDQKKKVLVAFENIFFTIYHNKSYDDSLKYSSSIPDIIDLQANKNRKDADE